MPALLDIFGMQVVQSITMEYMKRNVTCGECTARDEGKEVVLNGWVHRSRDHGGIHFINLRDRYGLTQVVVDDDAPAGLKEKAAGLHNEYCIAVRGVVRSRPDSMINPEMKTGEIEVAAKELVVLSECEVLPFMIDEESDAREDLRLTYRYLDLRSFSMQRFIKIRHQVTFAVREYLVKEGFYEIETPTLIRSTPEGARDFLVPARLNPGKFFALPQSPQLYKQILMVSGMDKYFQIARCYRDEDARGDRQLEFTQIDVEMSFVSQEDIFSLMEGLFAHIFKETLDYPLSTPFPRLTYQEAMDTYGSDKPDLRFDIPFVDFAPYVEKGDFKVFSSLLESGGSIKALVAPGCGDYSRKQIDELEETAKIYGAKGLAWMKVTSQGLEGGIGKFYNGAAEEIIFGLTASEGDLVLLVGDPVWMIACTALGAVRDRIGENLELKDLGRFVFTWIVDFPLFEWNSDEGKWDPAHHMFTMPKEDHIPLLEKDPGAVKGDVYDLVCNGNELASGSIRIHDPRLQKRIFSVLGFSEEEAERRFGFLLKAFTYGAPPHGGIAPGLDRLVMIMAGRKTIRDVIPFPKNTMGASSMEESPSEVDPEQLKELNLRVIPPEKPNT
jgi:aspartyl-tRNA synthetase